MVVHYHALAVVVADCDSGGWAVNYKAAAAKADSCSVVVLDTVLAADNSPVAWGNWAAELNNTVVGMAVVPLVADYSAANNHNPMVDLAVVGYIVPTAVMNNHSLTVAAVADTHIPSG